MDRSSSHGAPYAFATTRYSLVLLLAIAACKREPDAHMQAGDVTHPVARFRPTEGLQPNRISLAGPLSGASSFAEPDSKIGVLQDEPDYMFGEITDVVVSESNLLVLDRKSSEIRLYGMDGVLLARGGRAGTGPGEFRNPQTASVDQHGRIYIGGVGLTIDRFVRRGAVLAYDTAIAVGVETKGICIMNDLIYVHGTSTSMDGLIQVFDPDGKRKHAFGQLYKSGSPIIDFKVNGGRIACDTPSGIIAYSPSSLVGEVRAFTSEGRPLWRTEIEGFKPINLISRADGGSQVIVPPDGFHRVESFEFVSPDRIAVQVAAVTRASLEENNPFEAIRTILLNASDGSLVGEWQLPERLVGATTGRLVTATADPFPQLFIRSRPQGGQSKAGRQ